MDYALPSTHSKPVTIAILYLWFVLLLCCTSSPASADAIDAILDGFDTAIPVEPPTSNVSKQHSPYRVYGFVDLDMAWAIQHHSSPSSDHDYHGLAVLRPLLSLNLDYSFTNGWYSKVSGYGFYDFSYAVRGRSETTAQVLSTYEKELELDEAYLEGPLGPAILKFGRQVIPWGDTDIFRPLDILNPIDIRDPVFSNISGLRLPAWMSRIDWGKDSGWRFSALAIHENRADKIPAYGNDFYPFDFPLPSQEDSSFHVDETGLGFRATRSFHNRDTSFYLTSLMQEQDLVGITAEDPQRKRNRIQVAGLSGNLAMGSWLYKADLSFSQGLEFYQLPGEKKDRIDFATGFDYTGFENSFITFEIAYRHLLALSSKYKDNQNYPKSQVLAFGFHYFRSFFREKLSTSILIQLYGFDQGGVQQFSCSYAPWDNHRISGGLMLFQDGDNYIFEHIGKNNRFFLKYHVSF